MIVNKELRALRYKVNAYYWENLKDNYSLLGRKWDFHFKRMIRDLIT